MWVNKEVNIPERLITAQAEGGLVVFVGAGASVDPPSNLPMFPELAAQIAGNAWHQLDNEAIDAFIGRMEREVDAQGIVRRTIDDPNSQPCELHEHIVRLFGSPPRVRIVTTNFDRHLTTVARREYGDRVEIDYAPALPLGRDFSGIVYVHGSVDRTRPLVISDRDFGKAYLTEGWAARFLTDMFRTYSVLFVGYSHTDPVMKYIARAFGGETDRYALTPPGQDDHWEQLGIVPVHYPRRAAPRPHAALGEALAAWGRLAKMGVLDHERRIQDIVQSLPPLEPDVADYIASMVRTLTTLRLFVNHARGTVWLVWAERQGILDELFAFNEPISDSARLLIGWITEHFITSEPLDQAGQNDSEDAENGNADEESESNEALKLLARHNLQLNVHFWHAIGFRLARGDHGLDADQLARWVTALCASRHTSWRGGGLAELLRDQGPQLSKDTFVLLFATLVRPQAAVEGVFLGVSSIGVPYKWRLVGEREDIEHAWNEVVQRDMGSWYADLLPVLVGAIVEIYAMDISARGADNSWDRLSFSRAAIEDHAQNALQDDWEFIIEAVRDCLRWLEENRPAIANAVVDDWMNSDRRLLTRLALNVIAERGDRLEPEAALDLIRARGWLYSPPGKHEVYRLIEESFPRTTAEQQQAFINYSLTAPVFDTEDLENDADAIDTGHYERYNVAVWLARIAPNSDAAQSNLLRLQEQHREFQPRPYPDLDAWGDVGFHVPAPKAPIGLEELLRRNPDDPADLAWLRTYQPDEILPGGPERPGLLALVSEAARQDFDWSYRLASALVSAGASDSDLWPRVVSGWREASLSEERWPTVLAVLAQDDGMLGRFGYPVADLIERGLQDDGHLPPSEFTNAEGLLDRIIDTDHTQLAIIEEDKEWLTQAINHAGGRVALSWLKLLSRRRAAAEAPWPSLLGDYKARLAKLGEPRTLASQMALVVVASQIHFLFAIDREWTTATLVPWFDWQADRLRAEQAWHGFLTWGHWNDPLLEAMLTYTTQAFAEIDRGLARVRDRAIRRLAAFATFSAIDPWTGGWLMQFVSVSTAKTREEWAAYVGRDLTGLSEEAAEALWLRWIRSYWLSRLDGRPRHLEDSEASEMAMWVISFPAHVDEVIDMIMRGPSPLQFDVLNVRRIAESTFATTQPNALLRWLSHMLARVTTLQYACPFAEAAVNEALDRGAQPALALTAAESLARVGCQGAQGIANRAQRMIQENDGT